MQSKAAVTGNESVKYSSIQIEDGLSQISVVDIFQDSKGYLWFATRNGLNRYDGRDFKVFRHEKGNPGSLSDNHVTSLAEDNNGNLWIGTRHGLSKLDLSSEKVTAYVDSLAYKMFEDGIRALALDANGRVLIATPHGLFMAIDDDKFESILPEVKGTIVEGLAVTKDGRIFVGSTTNGLYILNKNHKPIKHFDSHNGSLPTNDIKEIYE
uniref:ligand-binding sensor domain-containing protein n=1 Tax=uncultured Duncaniella sp. TaxID=2768039 RepID=UPI00272C85C4